MADSASVQGRIVDIFQQRIYPGTITIRDGKIESIREEHHSDNLYILPGFIDAHIHIESSLLTPYEFSRLSLPHGTIATVSDPHEMANVLGMEGVIYMLENARKTPMKIYFGAPSCVPATAYETSGATLTASEIEILFRDYHLKYLAEMVNYPGVLSEDPVVMEKIRIAQQYRKVIDGHAPGLRGSDVTKYSGAGITTDHECFTLPEALDKLRQGMQVLIREGSAARNFDTLIPLIEEYSGQLMFCSDDKQPDDLEEGHINQLVVRAIRQGYDLFKVLQCACLNPVKHYGLDVGLLRPGDPADFIIVENLHSFQVHRTVINGNVVVKNGRCALSSDTHRIVNRFHASPKTPVDFEIPIQEGKVNIIEALDGQLITLCVTGEPKQTGNVVVSDTASDILKITVVNRYHDAPPSLGLIRNFGIKRGAIASSVAHDSHNIIAVGASDEELCRAVNLLMGNKGGLCVVDGKKVWTLSLPVAGLLSDKDGITVSREYARLTMKARELGSELTSPFMTLSFMALLVIPELKISDRGLFDSAKFRATKLFS